MQMWEQVLLGIGAVILVFIFWPGVKVAMQKSKEAENPDWQGVLLPIGVVVLFIILLVVFARG
ncbi:MAG: hypothetical protein GWO08_12360 [Gammaproteobacteria bacterium]|jgi:Na+/melibiose symporter-like transporter|nr:hypothetical protein [Gammaproteobacteria bacterium]NIN61042.1 hypothetical protein [Gammaproteobacteria bacterium]NIO62665.1 hypothetical protein [Gammaproteobacteria bacterium]NIP49418.1 hypothetical protein [Gammaproteobacteria bacterium]NIQ10642.1 hypothetical protein [Gammaproteobacteria bacterium]